MSHFKDAFKSNLCAGSREVTEQLGWVSDIKSYMSQFCSRLYGVLFCTCDIKKRSDSFYWGSVLLHCLCSCHLFVWTLMSLLLFPSVLFLDPANLTGKQTPPISCFPMSNRAFYFFNFFFTRVDLCRVRIIFLLHNHLGQIGHFKLQTKPVSFIKVTLLMWRSATATLLEFACISRRWSMMLDRMLC